MRGCDGMQHACMCSFGNNGSFFFVFLAACTSLYIQRSVLPYTQRALFLFCFLLGCFSRSAIHHPNSSTFHHTGTFVQVSTLESRCCRTRLVQTVLVLWRALARALSLHVWVIVSISQVPPHALAPWHTHARTHTHTHTHARAHTHTHFTLPRLSTGSITGTYAQYTVAMATDARALPDKVTFAQVSPPIT
jgi:hypothetical protein